MKHSLAQTDCRQVLIVEDHVQAGEVLKQAVINVLPGTTQLLAVTLTQARQLMASHSIDLLLLDLGLPDGNGIELIEGLHGMANPPLIIVTTIFDDEFNLFEALKAGANGYLLKGHSQTELEHFILEAVQGKPPLSPSIAQSVLNYFHNKSNYHIQEPEEVYEIESLTDREIEVLTLVAKGFRVREISGMLEVTENTISAHVKSIYRKLNVHNRAEATAAAVSLQLYRP